MSEGSCNGGASRGVWRNIVDCLAAAAAAAAGE